MSKRPGTSAVKPALIPQAGSVLTDFFTVCPPIPAHASVGWDSWTVRISAALVGVRQRPTDSDEATPPTAERRGEARREERDSRRPTVTVPERSTDGPITEL
jgi:hypothetical protein